MRTKITLILLATILLSGCAATVPLASLDLDAQAKRFSTDNHKSKIYLFRDEMIGMAIPITVSLDGQMAGQTGPDTYFLWSVNPGKHTVTSHAENVSSITLSTLPSNTYYIWQEIKMGMWGPRTSLQQVDKTRGQKGVTKSKRLQPYTAPNS